MKIGLLAYSTKTGLGYQTRDFYEFMNPDKVLIADLGSMNGMPTDHTWAFQPRVCAGIPSDQDCEWLVDGMDVIFVCETPLNHYLFEYAKEKGVKTVLQYNFEFLAYFRRPELAKPDLLASPSRWGMEIVEANHWGKVVHWPVPIDIKRFDYRKVTKVDTFAHIIGRPAAHDRNGTLAFLEAAKRLKQFKYVVYLQRPREGRVQEHFRIVDDALKAAIRDGVNLQIIEDLKDNRDMYRMGQVLVLPRRYGGLCLPMWEALASGMPVLMPDISPNDSILPIEWLIPAEFRTTFQAHAIVKLYDVSVHLLVRRMLEVAENIEESNIAARNLAESMSWDVQSKIYTKKFKELCKLQSSNKM